MRWLLLVAALPACERRGFDTVPPSGQWTWLGGPSHLDATGIYDVDDPEQRPGARAKAAAITGPDGRRYMFGGSGWGDRFAGFMEDMWELDVENRRWRWVGGGPLSNPNPPVGWPRNRDAPLSAVGDAGQLILFGGRSASGMGNQRGNGLWSFDPVAVAWTQLRPDPPAFTQYSFGTLGVYTDTNYPPRRDSAATWQTSDELWVYGGRVAFGPGMTGNAADLWRYEIGTDRWTWVSGVNNRNVNAVGERGVAAMDAHPAALSAPATWIGDDGELWLFGGAFYNAFSGSLWRFERTSGEWTWVGGEATRDPPGRWTQVLIADPDGWPGPREYASSWKDQQGRLWLFGGQGLDENGQEGMLNDLWFYDVGLGVWTWVAGDATAFGTGHRGPAGAEDPESYPSARAAAQVWPRADGGVILHGGVSGLPIWSASEYADLWQFTPPL